MDHTRLSSGSDVADEADAVASPIDDGSYKKDFKYRKNQIKLFFKDLFPFLKWLPLYHFREDILSDCLAGLTIGVIAIPMSLSYATVAGLPPVHGLYAAFVAIIPYFFFGTSPHLSNGPAAIMSMLVRQSIPREYHGSSVIEGSEQWINLVYIMSFVTGMLQVTFGFCRFGIFIDLISEPIVSAFTSAAAILIIGGQIPAALGIKKCEPAELWGASHADDECYLPEIVYSVIINIKDTHFMTFLFATVSCFVPWLFKYRLSRFHMILGSMGPLVLVSLWLPIFYYIEQKYGLEVKGDGDSARYFDAHFHVRMIGPLESGLPSPILPFKMVSNFRDVVSFLSPCLAIAVVGFVEAMTIGKAIAKKTGRGKLVANNELIALGASNIACSFFQGFAVTGSFSRTAVNAEAGARSPISSLCASIVCGIVLVFFTSSMQYLPRFVLASIVIMSSHQLVSFKEALDLWHVFKRDFWVFAIVFVGTLMVGVENGLLLGVLMNWVAILMHKNTPEAVVFVETIQNPRKLIDVTTLPDPNQVIESIQRRAFMTQSGETTDNQEAINSISLDTGTDQYECPVTVLLVHDNLIFSTAEGLSRSIESVRKAFLPKIIVLDFTYVQTIDSSGIHFLKEMGHTLAKYKVSFRIASVRSRILEVLHKAYDRIPELQKEWFLELKSSDGASLSRTDSGSVHVPGSNESLTQINHRYDMSIHETVGAAIAFGRQISATSSEASSVEVMPPQTRMQRQNTNITVEYEIIGTDSFYQSRNGRNRSQSSLPSFIKTSKEPFIVVPVPDISYYPSSTF